MSNQRHLKLWVHVFWHKNSNWFTKHSLLTCVDIWNSMLTLLLILFLEYKASMQLSKHSHFLLKQEVGVDALKALTFLKQPVAFNFHDNLRLTTVFTEDESNEDSLQWTVDYLSPSPEWWRRKWFCICFCIMDPREKILMKDVVRLIAYLEFFLLSDYCYIIRLVARGICVYFRL